MVPVGRLRVSRRQPGVERHERHLHRKSEKRAEEKHQSDLIAARCRANCSFAAIAGRICRVSASSASSMKSKLPVAQKEGQETQQQRHAADHRVNKKLRRRRRRAGPTPKLDQEECRDQAQFPEQEPVEEIQRGERAEQSRLQQQYQREVQWDALLRSRHEASIAIGTTIAESSTISRPRPSTPR